MTEAMSAFDPESFLHQETEAQFETEYTKIPDGDYTALIEKVEGKQITSGQIIADVTYSLMDVDKLKTELNLQQALVKQGLFLDYENGVLAEGANQNVNLGKLREAVGQNKKGKPWNFGMLVGAGPLVIHVVIDGDYNKVTRTSAPL